MIQELVDYVNQHRQAGFSDEAIRQELINAGWSPEDINNAFQPTNGVIPEHASQLKSVTGLLTDSWGLFRSRFKTLVSLAIFPAIIALLIAGVIIGVIVASIQSSTWLMVILFLIITVLLLFLILPVQPAIISNLKEDSNIGFERSYVLGFHYLKSYLWVIILYFLVMAGSLIIFMLTAILLLGGIALARIQLATPIVIVGYIILSIPAIILIVRTALSPVIAVAEDIRGMNALVRSRELTKGKLWATAWRLLLPILIILPVELVALVFPSIAQRVVSIAISIFLTPFILVYHYLIYNDLQRTYKPSARPVRKTLYVVLAIISIITISLGIAAFSYLLYRNRNLPNLNTSTLQSQTNSSPSIPIPLPHYYIDLTAVQNIPNGPTLGNYIVDNLNNGVSKDAIRAALLKASWKSQYIDQAFNAVHINQ